MVYILSQFVYKVLHITIIVRGSYVGTEEKYGRQFMILVLILFSQILNAGQVSPPAQPAKGPGGKEYSHSAVIKNRYEQGAKEY